MLRADHTGNLVLAEVHHSQIRFAFHRSHAYPQRTEKLLRRREKPVDRFVIRRMRAKPSVIRDRLSLRIEEANGVRYGPAVVFRDPTICERDERSDRRTE